MCKNCAKTCKHYHDPWWNPFGVIPRCHCDGEVRLCIFNGPWDDASKCSNFILKSPSIRQKLRKKIRNIIFDVKIFVELLSTTRPR